ncbi:MAG: SH3 domain-containing protein [Clostridia bacterium]|nr:SH3 domain-containing protein [Clostridia bacterium]
MKNLKLLLVLAFALTLMLTLAPSAMATEDTVVPVTSVNVSPSSLTLTVNGSESLIVTVSPGDTTQTGVVFRSSDSSVATVDASGRVTGVKSGSTIIYATSVDNIGVWGYCNVRVLENTKISLNKSHVSLQTGYTETLYADVSPNEILGMGVTFRSSNPNVAVVSNNGNASTVVTAVGPGTATIYAIAGDDTMATCSVSVGTLVTGVKLSRSSFSINTGSTTSLTATVEPSNATDKSVTWKSSNTNVVTVDNNGNITTWEAGYAVVTATSENGISGTCSITVVGVSVTHVPTATPSPTPRPTLAPGVTATPPAGGVTAYVNTVKGSLNLRATASSSGTILTTIPEKGAFTLLEKGSRWCKAWYKGVTGYVMTQYVRFDKELPTLAPGVTPTPSPVVTMAPGSPNGQLAYVNTVSGSLNMRATASTGGTVVRRIPEKAAFTVITYGDTWCHAWYNGSSGYVMTKYVRLASATATPYGVTATPRPATGMTPSPEPLTGSVARVSTKNGGSLNLRSAASSTSTRVRLIPNGTVINILQYGKEWCYASYNGSTGYVMTSFLSLGTGVNSSGAKSTSAPSAAATVPVSTGSTKYAQVNTGSGGLNLRKGAGAGYARITIIPKGAYVTLISEGTVWSQVNYNGTTGYVMSYYLKKL